MEARQRRNTNVMCQNKTYKMTNTWTDKIIAIWTIDKIKLSPPATIDKINATEESLIFQFPSDFKELYLKLDGFVDWDWTKNMFSIWPLERIVEEYNREPDKTFIVFCGLSNKCTSYWFRERENRNLQKLWYNT